jgi:hypothetical protein
MQLLAISGALLVILSIDAVAADAPNIVGTWMPITYASARIGTHSQYGSTSKPSLNNSTDAAFKLKIDVQNGNSFSGSATGPKGKIEQMVGAFRQDGKRFVFSVANGSASGELNGDELEFCFNDNIPNYVAAACTTYKRVK